MDLLKIYNALIEKRRNFPIDKGQGIYVEYHHIIPRCCGGEDTPRRKKYNKRGYNLIGLTAKEHRLIHLLLYKLSKMKIMHGSKTPNLARAFAFVNDNLQTEAVNVQYGVSKGLFYEMARIETAEMNRELGKRRKSFATRRKMSLAQKRNYKPIALYDAKTGDIVRRFSRTTAGARFLKNTLHIQHTYHYISSYIISQIRRGGILYQKYIALSDNGSLPDHIDILSTYFKTTAIVQYDLSGNEVARYRHPKDAQEKGFISTNIVRCCKQPFKKFSHHGFYWQYLNPEANKLAFHRG